MSLQEIKTIMMAASALPYVYDAVYYKDGYYRDGGLKDNIPIKPIYDLGIRNIIVVGLKPNSNIDTSLYPDCNFIFIKPSHSIGDFTDGTMDFSASGAKFRMALGYRNAARILNAYNSGKMKDDDYKIWLMEMSELDYNAALQDIRQQKITDQTDYHMDKLKSIYDKYMK